jgi:hypothetical protein
MRYTFKYLRRFITEGKLHGNVGMLNLGADENGIVKYKGFGTIENPCFEMRTLYFKRHPLFDDASTSIPSKYTFMLFDLK